MYDIGVEGFLPLSFVSLEDGDMGLETGIPTKGDVLENARTAELGGLPETDMSPPPTISPERGIGDLLRFALRFAFCQRNPKFNQSKFLKQTKNCLSMRSFTILTYTYTNNVNGNVGLKMCNRRVWYLFRKREPLMSS